jgi:Animal haem peroxidase
MVSDTDLNRRAFLGRVGTTSAGALVVLAGGGRALIPRQASGNLRRLPGTLAADADPGQLSRFGRMFPDLRPFNPSPRNPAAVLADLATLTSPGSNPAAPAAGATAPMVEPGGTDDTLFGAWFTYFGQFMCHDISFDQVPLPSTFINPETVLDFETARLDLSSVYGGGPHLSPQLYQADGKHFLTPVNVNGVLDLPRNTDGTAILVDPRNDEQALTSQMHLAFLKFHNAVVDLGYEFEDAAALVRQYYQWVVLNQWLPQICGQEVVDGILNGSIRRFYRPDDPFRPMIPVEWSVASHRLHSMIRNAYAMNLTFDHFPNTRTTLFNGANGQPGTNDLHGGRPLPASNVIDWGNFVNELVRGGFNPAVTGTSFLQAYKQIIPQLGASAFLLPIGGPSGVAPSGTFNLALRDLTRGYFYGLPSGQDVAAAMGNPVIGPTDVLQGLPQPVSPSSVPTLQQGTPLWLYILYEAYATGNTHPTNGFSAYLVANKHGTYGPDQLGPTGARISVDFFTRLLEIDPHGILNPRNSFSPQPPIAPAPGQFGFGDLLVFAGVATRP